MPITQISRRKKVGSSLRLRPVLSILGITLLLLGAAGFRPINARGESDSWELAKARLASLGDTERCLQTWSILWDWSKRGNQEARYLLLVAMMPPPGMGAMTLPGTSQDYVSRIRDLLIVAVHAEDYSSSATTSDYTKDLEDLYMTAGFGRAAAGQSFLECRSRREEDCVQHAVKALLVPSFEEFAAQIDKQTLDGAEPRCGAGDKLHIEGEDK